MNEEDVRFFYDRDGRPIVLENDLGSRIKMDDKVIDSIIQMATRSGKPLESYLQRLALKGEDIAAILQYAQQKGFDKKDQKGADNLGFQNEQTKGNIISKNLRILILLSIIWLFIFFLVGLENAAQSSRSKRLMEFTMTFSSLGVLPVVILWGIIWIRAAKK